MSLLEFAQQFQFDSIQVDQRVDHLPLAVAADMPKEDIVVFSVADEDSDTANFSARFGFSLEDCANTLILRYTKDHVEHYAAVVTLGSRRLDVNGAVKELLRAKRLSFARREVVTELTGMEFGGITAFGLPKDMRILIDEAVIDRQYVVMGAGYRKTKILLDPIRLRRLPNVEIAPLTLPPS
jgi:prolyl-tRNA editing enzyme YbaK/EbsC (Cys-tRNA(Pro) deacylase)